MNIIRAKTLAEKYRTLLNKNEVNTKLRFCHFFSQLDHESNLLPVSENLNYSSTRLLQIFPKYFNKDTAILYARKPERIANKVYANRMGNSNEESGDGWKYRGRGFIQITGKTNYRNLSNWSNVDYINQPDLLLKEPDAIISALWYWNSINGNILADKNQIETITKRINGGLNGFNHRKELLEYYLKNW